MMKSVKFIAGYPPYNAGEVATFDDEMADRLINELKVAVLFKTKSATKSSAKNVKKPPVDKMIKNEDVEVK